MSYLKSPIFVAVAALVLGCGSPCKAEADLVLTGSVTGDQHHRFLEVPFHVPPGTHRISLDFTYTGREQHTILDIGLTDPQRFRGASGSNKGHITIGESDATPSYLPGAIPEGEWKLLIAVPNIRPQEVSSYRAEIRFNSQIEDSGFTVAPLENGRRWYRGDLHMHTAHSDGSCISQGGRSVPCPLFLTIQTAASRGLDFIAITDHNTTSQYNGMRELQPYFDHLLLIPGREMTTFWGHFNVFGFTQFSDFRISQGSKLDINGILRDVRGKGGIASVNHALDPSGESCVGCRWEQFTPVDYSLITGVEVINGSKDHEPHTRFLDEQIAAGAHLVALGGSDNHNATSSLNQPSAIARPTTVVEAEDLSIAGILAGIRKGRVFVDLSSSRNRVVDMVAGDVEDTVRMGGSLRAAKGTNVKIDVSVSDCLGASVRLYLDGRELEKSFPAPVTTANAQLSTQWKSDGARHWIRAEVYDSADTLLLVSSPIYLNETQR